MQVCALVCAQVCASLCKFVQVCARLCKFVQVCASLCKFMQVCASLCKFVQVCASLCAKMFFFYLNLELDTDTLKHLTGTGAFLIFPSQCYFLLGLI